MEHRMTENAADKQQRLNVQFLEAAKYGNLTKVQQALNSGAELNAADFNGSTALHNAAEYGHDEIVEFLLTRVFEIELMSDPEASRINSGESTVQRTTNNNGETPLHKAAERGHDRLVRALLENGADVNAEDSTKNTPLHLATRGKMDAAVITLMKNENTDPNKQNQGGQTALDIAESLADNEFFAKMMSEAMQKRVGREH